ncbi:MAG: GTPase, partial [Deltaproteobacteria bacterium]
MKRKNIVIMGAGGRDFHNFNVLFRRDPSSKVVAFTAAQIPFIENRTYPPELSGKLYPKGIPVYPEEELAELVKKYSVNTVVFSYSDVSHEYVMHKASLATSLGADFLLLGAEKTMLKSKKPVISVCAVRTGCGKSAITRFIAGVIKKCNKTPVVIRHPMPYGDLKKQKLQRFETSQDMARAKTTIEEMEEYEHL